MRLAVVLATSLVALVGLALAAPIIPVPKLADVMRGSLTDRARIRWSKVVDGKRAWVEIAGGEAKRVNPGMSAEPATLKYDLDRNRALEKLIKDAHLGGSNAKRPSERPDDRTLEILAEGPQDFVVVGTWVMPKSAWKKRKPDLYEALDPLFDVQADVFGAMKGAAH